MEASGRRDPEEGHPESTTKTKDAKHLKEIEELRAIAGNEHELLKIMVQTLE